MYSIISSKSEPHHLKILQKWFETEWGKVNADKGGIEGFDLPPPLFAIDNHELVGGLAFSRYPMPGSQENGLWINALLMTPKHRNIGIGSQLIQAAESEAELINANKFFVYTDVSELYKKRGWFIVDDSGKSIVLSKTIICT